MYREQGPLLIRLKNGARLEEVVMKPAEPEAPLLYPAILTAEGGRTLVSFPDCPACRTFAANQEKMFSP